jgi:hypothetical protein
MSLASFIAARLVPERTTRIKRRIAFYFGSLTRQLNALFPFFFFDISVNIIMAGKKVADSFVSFPLDSIVTFKVTFLFYFMYLFMGLIFLINCF